MWWWYFAVSPLHPAPPLPARRLPGKDLPGPPLPPPDQQDGDRQEDRARHTQPAAALAAAEYGKMETETKNKTG